MNGSSAVTYPINEQLIGKFHVTNLEKPIVHQHHPLPMSSEDISMQRSVSIPDETACASRFQMIRVDRNFGRGRWKVNDYEPPENTSTSTMSSVNVNENELTNNNGILFNVQPGILPMTSTNLPTVVNGDANVATPAALTATAASVAVATATAFQQQQQQQQRMALNNNSTVVPPAAVPPPTGLLHGYPPGPITNQPYLLPNHHPQFGYYHFYPPPYSPYAPPWTSAALAAANPYLQSATMAPPAQQPQTNSQLSTNANLTDPDNNVENTFPNSISDLLPNAQLSAYFLGLQHPHPSYATQTSSGGSTYATIPSYHPVPSTHPSILPPQSLPLTQNLPNMTTDLQQSHQVAALASPKTDAPRSLPQQSSLITPKSKPLILTGLNGANNDLISSSPTLATMQPAPPSFISPITISATNAPTASLSDLWSYTTAGSPLNLTQTAQTAAVTAVTAMGLLNNETTSQNTEITNEILKGLTTPTKQNNTADIDNKISAAMDLVKGHLLSAVREEVTELRQQIRILNEKLSNAEHENAFLRQHVSSEIYALYNPTNAVLSSSNDSTSSTSMNINPLIPSSQPMPISSLSSISSATLSNSNLP